MKGKLSLFSRWIFHLDQNNIYKLYIFFKVTMAISADVWHVLMRLSLPPTAPATLLAYNDTTHAELRRRNYILCQAVVTAERRRYSEIDDSRWRRISPTLCSGLCVCVCVWINYEHTAVPDISCINHHVYSNYFERAACFKHVCSLRSSTVANLLIIFPDQSETCLNRKFIKSVIIAIVCSDQLISQQK